MGKPEHRAAVDRRGLRYPSDLTSAEGALVARLIRPAQRGGRSRSGELREVLHAILAVLWTGRQRTARPKDLPPRSTVWEYWDLREWDGRLVDVAYWSLLLETSRRTASGVGFELLMQRKGP